MGFTGVAHMWKTENTYKIFVGEPNQNRTFGDLGVYERIILKQILRNRSGMVQNSCKHDYETCVFAMVPVLSQTNPVLQ
jgi:hypothetical protein